MTAEYDVIVVGTGSMGAATCFKLAERGYRVLGLEQFDSIPHDKGSHSGQTRIIRKAYFEHPDYVPLLNNAYKGWLQLEKITNEQVYFKTGLLYCGPSTHRIIEGTRKAASQFNIALEKIGNKERFSAFHPGPDHEMLYEPEAGYLLSAKAISLYIREAKKRGADLRTGEKFLTWEKDKNGILVRTDKKEYHAKKLILTAGAWTGKIIRDMGVPLKITRQLMLWVESPAPADFSPPNFPCWMFTNGKDNGAYYGFPYINESGRAGLKFALHYPGNETDPDSLNHDISDEEIKAVVRGIEEYFPAAANPVVASQVCMYANSPDENFIIDRMRGFEGSVIIACGFSGHGFKFVPVVGEILADLAMDGTTRLPVGFLGLNRFR